MEYLIKIGISKEVVEEVKDNLTKGELESIINCMGRLESSILYLRELGVRNDVMEKKLIIDHHVLMPGRSHLEIALSKLNNVNDFVVAINEHVEYMDYLRNIS